MRAASAALDAHLGGEVLTLATCWRLRRRDGTEYGFTDHDETLVVGGLDYRADTGYVPTAVQASDNLGVDNLDVQAFLDDARLVEADLRAELYDYAECEVFVVNWNDLSQGTMAIKSGTLGEVTRQREAFVAEVRGPSQAMQQPIGEVLTPTCRANLGDARCTVDIAAITVTGTVTSVTSRRAFADTSRTEADAVFDYGLLTWTSGANNQHVREVKTYKLAGGAFELLLQTGFDIAMGDTYTVYPGCDMLWTTCHQKFDNTLNFRGEPAIPGQDEIGKFGTS